MRVHVICGWCGVVIQEGDRTEPTSHGMCLLCEAKWEAQLVEPVPEATPDV